MTSETTPDRSGADPGAEDKKGSEAFPDPRHPQAADEPRGDDEVRREHGAGDGDDPPPHDDDEPLRNS